MEVLVETSHLDETEPSPQTRAEQLAGLLEGFSSQYEQTETDAARTSLVQAHQQNLRDLFGLDSGVRSPHANHLLVTGPVANSHSHGMEVGVNFVESEVFEVVNIDVKPTIGSSSVPRTCVLGFLKRPEDTMDEIFVGFYLDGDTEFSFMDEEAYQRVDIWMGAARWVRNHTSATAHPNPKFKSVEPSPPSYSARGDEIAHNFRKVSPTSIVEMAVAWYGRQGEGLVREFDKLRSGAPYSTQAEEIMRGVVQGLVSYGGIEPGTSPATLFHPLFEKLSEIGRYFDEKDTVFYHAYTAIALEKQINFDTAYAYWKQQLKQFHASLSAA